MPAPKKTDLVAWQESHPWEEDVLVEQDLLLSRMLVAIYQDNDLFEGVLFRGGTALHKLHLPQAMRYSEDIDLVVDTSADLNKVLSRLKEALQAVFKHGDVIVNSKEQVEGLHCLTYQPKFSAIPGKRLSIKIDFLAQDPRSHDEPYEKTKEAIKHFGLPDAFDDVTEAAPTGKACSQYSPPEQEYYPS